jgi:branched-subunit amino acid transport protein
MSYTDAQLWMIILALGIGTFVIRFSFLGILGNRELPPWLLRHLRYTAVGILPAMVTPLVLWPAATGGTFDAVRVAAAFVALGIGLWTKNAIWAICTGMGAFWLLRAMVG